MQQRRALAGYRELFAELSHRFQKKVLIRVSPGLSWRMEQLAQIDAYREQVRAIASSHRCLVIEGDHIWGSIRALLKAHDTFICHANRRESIAHARQLQTTSEVIEHAATVLCHPTSWDTIMKRSPNMSYANG